MKWLINYFRQAFCKHDFHIEEKFVNTAFKDGTKVYMRCKICGHNSNHWKYL